MKTILPPGNYKGKTGVKRPFICLPPVLLFSLILGLVLVLDFPATAQRTIKMRTLWSPPQVHVLFQGYTISFTIRDINKALSLLAETGDTLYGSTSNLDTGRNYAMELYPGTHTEYHNRLQPLMQKGVGVFLLLSGHALVENKKHKLLRDISSEIGIAPNGEPDVLINFYDPLNHNMLFSGKMKVEMYNKDLGIDVEE